MVGLARIRRVGVVVALAAVTSIASCATESTNGQGFTAATKMRHDVAGAVYPFQNLGELLGNTLYRVGDRPPAPITAAVVTGRFLDLEPGRGFTVLGSDAPGGTETGFEDADAMWRTMHARFAVDEVISGSVLGPEITVGLAFDVKSELGPIRADLLRLGRVVVFLERSPVFGYDSSVYSVVLDGSLVATIDPSGDLSLPALEAPVQERLLSQGGSVASLMTKAREPHTIIELDASGTERLRP